MSREDSDLSTPPSSDDEPLIQAVSKGQGASGPSKGRAKRQPAARRPAQRSVRRKTNKVVILSDSDDAGDEDFVAEASSGPDSAEDDDDIVVIKGAGESDEEDDVVDVKEPSPEPQPRRRRRATGPRRRRTAGDGVDENGERLPRHVVVYNRRNQSLLENHPELKTIFEDLENEPKIQPEAIEQPKGMVSHLLPFQREGLNWLIKQEQRRYRGGILADEMGMGKTIQTVSLFMSDPEDAGPVLVVAPTVALIQWKNEIAEHTGDKVSVLVFHGQNRTTDREAILGHRVVLTTYAVLESVWRKQQSGFVRKGGKVYEKSLLHQIEFHRVVLDEAHNIKDRQSNTARAVFNLNAKYRLCLSGTPLQNRIGEIYSLFRFLQIEPFCQYFCIKCPCASNEWKFSNYRTCDDCGHVVMQHVNFFNHAMLRQIQRNGAEGEGMMAMGRLRSVLSQIMLRRTKIERADDLGLPPRVVEIRRDYFNEEEKDLYASIYSDSHRKFSTYVNQGVVLNNYANIFTLITRMRQIADHPDLVLRRHTDGEAESTLVCSLCDDEAEEAIQSRCHHTFCRMCIKEYVEGWTGREEDLECPVCHVTLSIDLTAPAMVVEDSGPRKKESIVNRINMTGGWRSSTKIEALVEELFKLRSDRQTIKSIVFSQFTSMLDLVEWRLRRAGFQTVKLQGSMSPTQRDSVIRHFMETPSVDVFLVSLKAGGVALNLCEASQVFILDPWWNPSVEWQSGDRVHRIGQHRPVKITRLVIEDSIESRIVELQEKKASMIHATIGADDACLNRLTPADMQFLFQN